MKYIKNCTEKCEEPPQPLTFGDLKGGDVFYHKAHRPDIVRMKARAPENGNAVVLCSPPKCVEVGSWQSISDSSEVTLLPNATLCGNEEV